MKQATIKTIKAMLLPLLVGLLAGLLIADKTDLYRVLIKPPFALPAELFSVIWTVLYLCIGVAFALFLRSDATDLEQQDGTLYFYTQLFLNFLWPLVFFRLQLYFAAFLLLLALFFFATVTAIKFYRIHKLSGILFVPYLLYILYAGYLNFGIWFLNM